MTTPKLTLYHYWRSSSSWRVRWALELKSLACEMVAVDLLNGESESAAHLARNPLGYVPALAFDGELLIESMAIIEWLDETHPSPTLLPKDALSRARVRALAEVINADTQPLQNLGPQHLHSEDPEKRKAWAQHWIRHGLQAYETLVAKTAGKYSFGDEVTLADLFLIPQCYNAERFEVALDAYPHVARINRTARATAACQATEPDRYKP